MLFCISRDLQASATCRAEDLNEIIEASSPDPFNDSTSPVINPPDDSPKTPHTSKLRNNMDMLIIKLKATVFAPEKLNAKLGTGKV